jgi:4'-phosphopantetheinyl transferase
MPAPAHPAGWSAAQRLALPADDSIHLYWCELGGPASADGRPALLLSPDELARAQRMEPATAARFVRRRAALRLALGQCLGQTPQALRFAYGPQGKPRLETGELSFSLAQRGDVMLLALGHTPGLGVDLELATPRDDYQAIADSYFSARDAAALRAQPPGASLDAFYCAWTRREAVVKADGRGVGLPLESFDVLAPTARHSGWVHCCTGAMTWHWYDVPVGAGWYAALAASEPCVVRHWRLAVDALR